METIDLFFRFSAIGVLGLLCMQFVRAPHHGWLGVFGALFTFGIAAYLVCNSPYLQPHLGWALYPLLSPAIATPLLFYLFARALFDDDFKPAPWHAAVLIVLELTVYLHFTGIAAHDAPLMIAVFAVNRLVALGIAFAALITTLRGRVSDLVEGRRSFRLVFVVVVGLYVVLVLAIEAVYSHASAPAWLDVLNAGAILMVSGAIALFALPLRTELLRPVVPRSAPSDRVQLPSASNPAPVDSPAIDPADRAIVAALERAMAVDRLYGQEGLTIGALAKALGTQEHRLRRLINQHLGHRNFAAFLNQHRIAEVCEALRDPAKDHLPVLTLAMDAGYRSLGPFNLAFKQATGLTPTEYRRARPMAPPTRPEPS